MPRPGHPAVGEEDEQTMKALVLVDQKATIHELANDAGLAPSTVVNILKKCLGMLNIASYDLIPYDLTKNKNGCDMMQLVHTWSLLTEDHYY